LHEQAGFGKQGQVRPKSWAITVTGCHLIPVIGFPA
jgi:hypothetical protein